MPYRPYPEKVSKKPPRHNAERDKNQPYASETEDYSDRGIVHSPTAEPGRREYEKPRREK